MQYKICEYDGKPIIITGVTSEDVAKFNLMEHGFEYYLFCEKFCFQDGDIDAAELFIKSLQ